MEQSQAKPVSRLAFVRRSVLMSWNLQLEEELKAVEEENRQLRAALALYSEVARRTAGVPAICEQVA